MRVTAPCETTTNLALDFTVGDFVGIHMGVHHQHYGTIDLPSVHAHTDIRECNSSY